MFTYKPELATADDDEADDVIEREMEEEEEGVEVHELEEAVIDLGGVRKGSSPRGRGYFARG